MLSAPCSAFFGTGSTKKSTTARTARNTASVRYWRLRYALAPSWMARAISFIFSVPSGAASTSRTRYQANSNATSETPKMSHRARFSPDPNRAWIGPLSWASQPTIEPPTLRTDPRPRRRVRAWRWNRRGYPRPGALTCDVGGSGVRGVLHATEDDLQRLVRREHVPTIRGLGHRLVGRAEDHQIGRAHV